MSFAESTGNQDQILSQLERLPNNWDQEISRPIGGKNSNESSHRDISSNHTLVSTPTSKQHSKRYSTIQIDNIERGLEHSDEKGLEHKDQLDIDQSITKGQQFDMITTNVNQTLEELSSIYNQIGYSTTEISIKKSEIFQVIDDTISAFTNSLRREKNNIENECEWLRQQIRIILAMLNDTNGDKHLSTLNRGIVFSNKEMYEDGYKQEALAKLTSIQNRKHNFYASSPFNDTIPGESNESTSQNQFDYINQHIPHLSLLQTKGKLNSVFLDVLKAFIKTFKKLNTLNTEYIDIIESIGQFYSSSANVNMLKSLPSKAEADEHRLLIEQFDLTVSELKLNDKANGLFALNSAKNADDNSAFIISSPRKSRLANQAGMDQTNNDNNLSANENVDHLMEHLRELNYKIVRVIRGLKLAKITPDIISSLQREIEFCEAELEQRHSQIRDVINKCLLLIDTLHINEEQLINIQKQYDVANKKNAPGNEGYFDSETLKFVQSNPKEFGLMDHHIDFIKRLASTLNKIKEAKQKKWDYYLDSCTRLWDKLGENRDQVESFLNSNSSLTDLSLMNFKIELKRLLVKRSEFIESFIADTRNEIEVLHTRLYYSEMQRREFKYHDYDVNDDSLDKEVVFNEHEQEVSKLKEEFNSKEPILTLYSHILELLQDQKFLEESSKDSSRLLSKNSCKILLHEEKIRKNINKNMPKLISDLKGAIISYNRDSLVKGEKPLTINGEDFFEKLLVIETQQMHNRGGRSRVSRNPTRQSSPKKQPLASSLRTSPIRKPLTTQKPVTMYSRARGGTSPKRLRPTHPSILSPSKNVNVNPRRPINSKAGAIHSSNHSGKFRSEPGSRRDSPVRMIERSNSNVSKIVGNQLHSSNIPVLNFDKQNKSPTESLQDLDNTVHSNISRYSPLRINDYQPDLTKSHFSPVDNIELVDANEAERHKYSMSPIKILPSQIESMAPEPMNSAGDQMSSLTGDSSTIMGDDYQAWRDERLRQLNDIKH